MTKCVLILGAYGTFGAHITQKLAEEPDLQVIIAGRSEEKCRTLAERFRDAPNPPQWRALDIYRDLPAALKALTPDIVIHTCGPFQGQGYAVAQACIDQGSHYIDLADGRAFVAGIGALDERARAKSIAVISGASSVPGLTSAVIDHFLPAFGKITSVRYAISTAQKPGPGLATTAAVLGYAGKPFTTLDNGQWTTVYGWQDLHSHTFPGLGRRWLGNCDIPDLELFPQRYPDLKTIRFSAGLELPDLQLGLWSLSWLVRAGLVKNLGRYARLMLKASRLYDRFGSDRSAFYMELSGTDAAGVPQTKTFFLLAGSGHGPFIPATPAILLTKMLARDQLHRRGAFPCMGLITLYQYLEGLKGLDVRRVIY
ncbi:MAG: saccharopine dehydrogenase NADP-binding domain-containing protein [Pseudomonadota bacterium]|nr:saccharopine dehydrogenase NADP-binding domain-containing protein [Pseudomonadota bacterium]